MSDLAIAYGRKSFDDPDRRTSSVDDQHQAALAYAARNGFDLVSFHGDDGITGATMERPGLQAMLAAIRAGKAKILIIEDVDRLGRDQEHLQHMMKIFRLHNVVLHTVAAGRIDDLVFAFKGIIGEQQRMRIAYTTRRGLKGKASRGGSTGGKTLGYVRKVIGQAADGRDIDSLVTHPQEAALVRRIFELYASGLSLKKICAIMNAEGIPSPRARQSGPYNSGIWNPTTLSGDPALGEGILNNETYIGRRIFNRRTWIEVPNETRGFSRRPRLNPESEWIINEAPDLRIIDQDLWQRVKDRQAEARTARNAQFKLTNNPLSGAKRPAHLLSGLVECGCCNGPFVGTGGRWRCKAAMRQACANSSIRIDQLETRVLAGLRDKLLTPEIIGMFARRLQEELDEQRQAADIGRDQLEAQLAEVRGRMARLTRRIEDDEDAPRTLIDRLKALESEETQLAARIDATPERTVVRLPANYERVYRRAIDELESHLRSEDGIVARESVRVLIERVVVQPGDERGGKHRNIQLHGDLFRMLDFAEAAVAGAPSGKRTPEKAQKPRACGPGALSVTSLVAGTGFEPVTFRL